MISGYPPCPMGCPSPRLPAGIPTESFIKMKTFKSFNDVRKDLFNSLIAVDVQDKSASAIETQEGLGFSNEYFEPVGYNGLRIVDPTFLLVPDT